MLIPLFLATSVVWFFFAIHVSPILRQRCVAKEVVINGLTFDTSTWYAATCLDSAQLWHSWQIGLGVINLIQTYFGIVLVIWATDLRRQVRQSRRRATVLDDRMGGGSGPNSAWDDKGSPFSEVASIEDARSLNFEKISAVRVVDRDCKYLAPNDFPAMPKPTICAAMMAIC